MPRQAHKVKSRVRRNLGGFNSPGLKQTQLTNVDRISNEATTSIRRRQY